MSALDLISLIGWRETGKCRRKVQSVNCSPAGGADLRIAKKPRANTIASRQPSTAH